MKKEKLIEIEDVFNAIKKLILFGLLIVIFTMFTIFIFVQMFVAYEAITEKELGGDFFSIGNCRIVNTIAAIKGNTGIRIYKYTNGNAMHLITLDSDGKIYDKSRIKDKDKSLDGKELSFYEERKDNPPILIYANKKIYNYDNFNVYLMYGYVSSFKFFYCIKNYFNN